MWLHYDTEDFQEVKTRLDWGVCHITGIVQKQVT